LLANVFASTKGLSLCLDVLRGESFIIFLRFKFRGLREIEKRGIYIEVAMLMGTTIAKRNVFIVQILDPICILICKTNALRNTNIDIHIYENPFIGHASSFLVPFSNLTYIPRVFPILARISSSQYSCCREYNLTQNGA
jgi:hypothetical protein